MYIYIHIYIYTYIHIFILNIINKYDINIILKFTLKVMESCMCISLKQAFIEYVPCPTLSELCNFKLLHDYAKQVQYSITYRRYNSSSHCVLTTINMSVIYSFGR